jgi:hypothetical protein
MRGMRRHQITKTARQQLAAGRSTLSSAPRKPFRLNLAQRMAPRAAAEVV